MSRWVVDRGRREDLTDALPEDEDVERRTEGRLTGAGRSESAFLEGSARVGDRLGCGVT